MDRNEVIKGLGEISDYFFSVYRHSKYREEINEAKDRCDADNDDEFTFTLGAGEGDDGVQGV